MILLEALQDAQVAAADADSMVLTSDKINLIEALSMQSQDDNFQSYRTERQITRKLGSFRPSVNKIVKRNDLRLKGTSTD